MQKRFFSGELRISSLNKPLTNNSCNEQKGQMEYLTRTVWLLSILCTCQCDRFRILEDRLRFLERRISSESDVRSHDISTVFRRLDEMDLLINTTLEETFEKFKSDDVCGSARTIDEVGLQQEYRKLLSDIKILRLAFQSQKLYSLEIGEKYAESESNFEQLKQKSEEEKQVIITAHKNDRDETEKKFAQLSRENQLLVEAHKNDRGETEKKFAQLRTENEQLKRKTEEERQVFVTAQKKDRDENEKKFAQLRTENEQLKRKTEEEKEVIVTAQKKDRDENEKKFAQLRTENEQLKRKTEEERQVMVTAQKKDSDVIEKKFTELRQENVRLVEALKVLEVRLQKHERVHVHWEFSSCKDALDKGFTSSGLYYLKINDEYNKVLVYCDQETYNGGWTVFQRRKDGSEDFYRGWDDYRDGFGDVEGEFWLGNKYINALTGSRSRDLRIDLGDFEGNKAFAKYRTFRIANELENYTLARSEYEGNASDSLKNHNGQGFTTKDRDNDQWETGNCAVLYTGAWWYEKCHDSNLNGHYYQGDNSPAGKGVIWHYWKNTNKYSLKFVEMKLR